MTDFFAYNGEDVVPTYMPGVTSYGQEGSEGNTGDNGPSVYYTSYNLSDEEEQVECNLRIANNQLLSNNLQEDSYNTEYMEGDIVIDSVGGIYTIGYSSSGTLAINVNLDAKQSSTLGGELFKNFNARIVTSYLKQSKFPCYIKNPNNISYADMKSYKLYHSDILKENYYGNWVSFSIVPLTSQFSNFSYTFSLVLPNGEILQTNSLYPNAKMFVDNRYLYACYNCSTTSLKHTEGSTEVIDSSIVEKMFGKDTLKKIGTKTIDDIIDYKTFFDNGEDNKFASMLVSYYIHKFCSAYVEIKNTATRKIYRYDLDEIGMTKEESESSNPESSYIEPYIEQVSWDYEKDSHDDKLPPISIKEKEDEENTLEITRSFNNFVVLPSRTDDKLKSAEYEYIQSFYFTDIKGTTYPEGESYSPDRNAPLDIWTANNIEQYPHTLKLDITRVGKLNLNIRYNSFITDNPDERIFPATIIYVGYPNLPLYHPADDEDGNVHLPNSIKSLDGKADGSAGIYYLYKIIPYGYELNDGTVATSVADAGYSVVSIDLTKYTPDEEGNFYIEIGAMVFNDFTNDKHRKTIFPQDGISSDTDLRLLTPEEIHGGGSRPEDAFYTFAGEGEEINAGESEVIMFINNISENDNVEQAETQDFNIVTEYTDETNTIDYEGTGILWDPITYKITRSTT